MMPATNGTGPKAWRGFRTLDLDTMLPFDDKVLALQRAEPAAWGGFLGAYILLLADCWRVGKRLPYGAIARPGLPVDATPLVEVGLLDDDLCIPAHAWERWYGAAEERRAGSRDRSRKWRLDR
jgi:hypothetical protein